MTRVWTAFQVLMWISTGVRTHDTPQPNSSIAGRRSVLSALHMVLQVHRQKPDEYPEDEREEEPHDDPARWREGVLSYLLVSKFVVGAKGPDGHIRLHQHLDTTTENPSAAGSNVPWTWRR
jgi:hypothetical protein